MSRYLSLFGSYYRAGLLIPEIMGLIRDELGVDEYFFHAIELGVNPCELRRIGKESWEVSFRRAVKAAENLRAKDRLHNQSQELARGRVLDHEQMYPTVSTPYMPAYMRKVLSHVHDDDVKPKKCEAKHEIFAALREMGHL